MEKSTEEKIEQVIHSGGETKKNHRLFFIVGAISVVSIFILGGVAFTQIDASYKDRVFPGIHVGSINIGGMHTDELTNFLDNMNDKLSADGFHFTVKNSGGEKTFVLSPVVESETTSYELMGIDEQKEAERLVNIGKRGNVVSRLFTYARTSWTKPQVLIQSIIVDQTRLKEALEKELLAEVKPPKNADIVVASSNPLDVQVIPSQAGVVYDYAAIQKQLIKSWSQLVVPDITLTGKEEVPSIQDDEVKNLVPGVSTLISMGPLHLVVSSTEESKAWDVNPDVYSQWIGVKETENGEVKLGVRPPDLQKFLETRISPDVEVEAADARFTIGPNGKVQEFKGATQGIKLDQEKIVAALDSLFDERIQGNISTTSTIELALVSTLPSVQTQDVNNLGISSVLGVGTSNFKGSPANRIHNIKMAVQKLNGILIKPGEEFSAIAFTQPYTLEAGYLPEKVIKGDKITPEIGGGLCQVGTTLFRMAMNSGMDITERRNHSLVVSYYNDPQNNLPGTDATIYDPAPDFKFKNDTNSYVLIQTSVNVEKGDLTFTLWGTKDGRKGSYTKPKVLNWIPAGASRVVESPSLKPGEKECQHAFPGANTTFTYTRVMPDGTEQVKVFDSHYRPLPEICIVGVDPNKPAIPPASEASTTEAPTLSSAETPIN